MARYRSTDIAVMVNTLEATATPVGDESERRELVNWVMRSSLHCTRSRRLQDGASECGAVEQVPVHHSRRISPSDQQPVNAWTENKEERPGDKTYGPGENRHLLPTTETPAKYKYHLHAGPTMGVHNKYYLITMAQKEYAKTKLEKKEEKLRDLLKPPYFIVFMIILLVLLQISLTTEMRLALEWKSVGGWWYEPWRLLTYGCVHASHAHLALNALLAVVVGWPLECEQGACRTIVLWAGGVAAGALGAGALQPGLPVVGASAAVYSLVTAHIANVCLRFGNIPLWWFRPLSVVVLGTSEVWALVHPSTDHNNVAWAAHIFGASVGIPLGFIVFTGENKRKAYVITCRVISGMLLTASVVVATGYYSSYMGADQT